MYGPKALLNISFELFTCDSILELQLCFDHFFIYRSKMVEYNLHMCSKASNVQHVPSYYLMYIPWSVTYIFRCADEKIFLFNSVIRIFNFHLSGVGTIVTTGCLITSSNESVVKSVVSDDIALKWDRNNFSPPDSDSILSELAVLRLLSFIRQGLTDRFTLVTSFITPKQMNWLKMKAPTAGTRTHDLLHYMIDRNCFI